MNINWYPGHMKKTKEMIVENMKVIEIVYWLICEIYFHRRGIFIVCVVIVGLGGARMEDHQYQFKQNLINLNHRVYLEWFETV